LEDLLIAASAIVNEYTVATANTRHFSRIKGLVVENWLEKCASVATVDRKFRAKLKKLGLSVFLFSNIKISV